MSKTRHIKKRMSQRGIRERLIKVVTDFGAPTGTDKVILNKKSTEEVLRQLDLLRKNLLDIHKKGGLVVVDSGGKLITSYRLSSYQRL